MTFRFGNDETLRTRTLTILPVGIAGVNGVLRVFVVLGGARLLLSREFLKNVGCHIDLGRGQLFFEKLNEQTIISFVTASQEVWYAGTKIPAEMRPRIISDECAIYHAKCDGSKQKNQTLWAAQTSDQTTQEEQDMHHEAQDYWEDMGGRWVRVHNIARRTPFDPMHDEQPFCQNLTGHRRTTLRFL